MNEWSEACEVDEAAVRELLKTLGYDDPTQEDIEATLAETLKEREQRLLLSQEIPTPAATNDVDDLPVQRAVHNMDKSASFADGPVLAPGHVLGVGAMFTGYDEDEIAADSPHKHGGSTLASVTGRTTSTPAGPARTPVTPRGGAYLEGKRSSANRRMFTDGLGQSNGAHFRASGLQASSARSSKSVSVTSDPYYRHAQTPLHEQHFEPYVKMMQRDMLNYVHGAAEALSDAIEPEGSTELHSTLITSTKMDRNREAHARPTSSSVARYQRGASAASNVPKPNPASNVIYAFTGNRAFRTPLLSTRGTAANVHRAADPVSRGAQMRSLWERDRFLTQKGRKDERWMVRQSMLAWAE